MKQKEVPGRYCKAISAGGSDTCKVTPVRGRQKGSVFLTYLCAMISLGLGLYMHNYSVLVDIVLIVALALGVQIAKSHACAVLLLVYSCISMILTLVSTGRVTGFWLIIVGVWAVMGTFHFHKDYQKYLLEMK